MQSLYHFWTAAAGGTPLEWVAVVTGFLCVWLATRESLWNFPVAIFSCALYVVVYHRSQLYSDQYLQLFFISLSCYGWYEWVYGGQGKVELPITRTRPLEWAVLAVVGLAGTLGWGYYLAHYTDDALPYWDSLTTAGSLVGQYLLMRKRLENWLIWIAVDAFYVPILWYKHLYPTSALYALYLGLALYGYLAWRRSLRATPASSLLS